MKAYITFLSILLLGFSSVSAQNNSSNEPYIPIVDLLEVGEQYEIVIQSVGCFNSKQQSLFISRDENTYFASLNDSEISLNQNMLNALQKFERRLKYAGSGACTTVDTYILKYGQQEKLYKDGTCALFLGRELLEELGFSN